MASPAATREELLKLNLSFWRDKRDSPRGVLMSLEQWTALIDALGKLSGLKPLAGKLDMMFGKTVRLRNIVLGVQYKNLLCLNSIVVAAIHIQ